MRYEVQSGILLLASVIMLLAPTSFADQPDWQKNIDWAIGDTGAPDCPGAQAYLTYPGCLTLDVPLNRACLMRKAISSAKANDIGNVKWLVLTTQCHNDEAYRTINAQSDRTIAEYLKTK